MEDISINDVVQISPEVKHQGGFWAGNFLTVTEVFSWGVQGFCKTQDGFAFIRLNKGQFHKIGSAEWVLQREED